MTVCRRCGAIVRNMVRHQRRNRCSSHGRSGVKAGSAHGTPNRRHGGR